MPRATILTENTKKHLTNTEKKARKQAENNAKSTGDLVRPKHIKENPESDFYWKKTIKELKKLDLIGTADSDIVGTYCQVMARLESYYRKAKNEPDCLMDKEFIKLVNDAENMQLRYADRLGLNPSSRLQLAKRTAEQTEDPNEDLFG